MLILESLITGCETPALSRILLVTKNILNLVQIIGPILLGISLTITLTKLVTNPEEKKYFKQLKNSIFAILFLFAVPVLVNATMAMFDTTFSVSRCWNSVSDYSGEATFQQVYEKKRNKISISDDSFEKGEERKENNDGSSSNQETIEGTAQSYKDVVWDSGNISRKSNLTSQQLIKVLNSYGGRAKNFVPYAQNYITAENKYNVNVFFLIGLNALESGWGTSGIAKSCNNLGGVCQSSAHPSNGCGRNSNCSFAHFNSVGDFIDYNANMLNKNYLTPGGTYFEGKNLSSVYTRHYCPGCNSAAGEINKIATGLFNQVSKVM